MKSYEAVIRLAGLRKSKQEANRQMTAKLQVLPDPQINPWPVLWESFERPLQADGASVQTLRMYREAGGQAQAYFAERGLPTDPQHVEKRHVEAWLA